MWRLAIAAALLGACNDKKSDEAQAPSTTAVAPPPAPPAPPKKKQPPIPLRKPCEAEQSELVYVLADDNELFSFDPQKLPGDPFHLIARLDCGLVQPNSMAVDRFGIAWISDHNAQLFRASILDGRCEAYGTLANHEPLAFGMGFVVDDPKEKTETLYVASDPSNGKAPSTLGTLDTSYTPPRYATVGVLAGRGKWNPEFTGTSDGRLFAYFPLASNDGFVQEVDRKTGAAIGKRWDVPTEVEVGAWAFAQWGGKFYVFTKLGTHSVVHQVDPKTGEVKRVQEHVPFSIIGAGVSTCAPILEKAT